MPYRLTIVWTLPLPPRPMPQRHMSLTHNLPQSSTTKNKIKVATSTVIKPTSVVRDYLNDSRVWTTFLEQGGFVEGDIVVVDPFKAGTTWTQNILHQILTNGAVDAKDPSTSLSATSPWLDSSWGKHEEMLATLLKQKEAGHRRVIKSHLPADAIPLDPKARYIFVGRNGKDLGISFHNYLTHFTPATMEKINEIHAAAYPDTHKPLAISASSDEFLNVWLDTQGTGCCDLFRVVKSWWELTHTDAHAHSNILLLHYADMLKDPAENVRKIASFIGMDPSSLDIEKITQQSSFSFMKAHADKMAPFGGGHMTKATAFFDKGPDRDFRSEMKVELIEKYDAMAVKELGKECAEWLEKGVGK